MTRMGHDSPRAALIYQHADADADRAISDALDATMTAHKAAESEERDGRAKLLPEAKNGPEEGNDEAAGALVPVA